MMIGKRFVSWVAVSSRPQMDGGSPTDQRERNLAHIAKYDGVLVADLEVPGQSRSYITLEEAKEHIEAYRELEKLIKARACDVLICYNVGRLGRKRSLITTVIDLCHDAGIMVYRTSSPPASLEFTRKGYSDLLVEGIESANYQNEVDQLVEHHRTGMIRRAKRGSFPNNIPYGYRKRFDNNGNPYIVIDDHEAEGVRLILTLYSVGETIEKIIERLTNEGFYAPGRVAKIQENRKGKHFIQSTIKGIVERAWVYAGYVELNKRSKENREFVRVKSSHIPEIIDEVLVQRVLAEKQRRASRLVVYGKNMLSGVVWCTDCNRRLAVKSTSYRLVRKDGSIYRFPALICWKCRRSVSQGKVKRALAKFFASIPQDIPSMPEEKSTGLHAELDRVQSAIDGIVRARARAFDAYVREIVDEATYHAEKKRLDGEEKQLQDRLDLIRLEIAQEARKRRTEEEYKNILDVGMAMLELGETDPKAVNSWLREFIRVEFDQERNLIVSFV